MAISESLKAKIAAFSRQLAEAEEIGLEDTLFEELEADACEIGDACMQQFSEAVLARRAAKTKETPSPLKCPHCGREGQRTGERIRELLTCRGPVQFTEPECYCRKCRRSFFPSVPSTGTGCGVRLLDDLYGHGVR